MNTAVFRLTPCATLLTIVALTGCGGSKAEGGGATTPPSGEGSPAVKQAIATLEARSGATLVGTATFTGEGDKVSLKLDVTGAPPGEHAVHLHEKGDCSAPDAMSAGDHWNPTNKTHGQWGKGSFHLGDIGNMKVGDDGRGSISMETDQWSLVPDAMDSVLGRSIVVHAQPDDLTTQPAGAAGARIGCGVIQKK